MKKVIIGIGNPLKKDDNIGNIIVEKLKKRTKDQDLMFVRAETNPENYISKIKEFEPGVIYFIDAAEFDGEAGEIRVFQIDDVLNESLSTHGISVKIFRNFFPETEIRIIGIKVEDTNYGEGLSRELEKNKNNLTENISKILSQV
ncbi:MAG: hydrogenase maturation protease [Candidatus Aenigmarchaeota archaeon]|nr:hydrogenase maturation protease [Candidatus Aenigmarchaeota archaeon]